MNRSREQAVVQREPLPTPDMTIEALMYALRSGLACLDDPANIERLRRCDPKAMEDMAGRLRNMRELSKGARPDWPDADIQKLAMRWRDLQRPSPRR